MDNINSINIARLNDAFIKSAKIYLAPSKDLAEEMVKKFQELNLDYSTVEAEYGDTCIPGSESMDGWATLAHHGSRSGNKAPCVWTSGDEKFSQKIPHAVLLSHLDPDSLGGIGRVLGFYNTEEQPFWEAVALIDVKGPHHIGEVPEQEAARLRAFWAYNEQHRSNPARDQVSDVTDLVLDYFYVLDKIVHDDTDMINAGLKWEKHVTEAVEAAKVYESEKVRAFKGALFTASSYLGTDGIIREATVSLNTKFNAITLAFEDGGEKYNAAGIMKDLFGPDAGGRAGIAGTPRGVNYGDDDLKRVIEVVEELLSK